MSEMSQGHSNHWHISYDTYHTDVKYPNEERHLSRAITRALHRNSPRGKSVSKSYRKETTSFSCTWSPRSSTRHWSEALRCDSCVPHDLKHTRTHRHAHAHVSSHVIMTTCPLHEPNGTHAVYGRSRPRFLINYALPSMSVNWNVYERCNWQSANCNRCRKLLIQRDYLRYRDIDLYLYR